MHAARETADPGRTYHHNRSPHANTDDGEPAVHIDTPATGKVTANLVFANACLTIRTLAVAEGDPLTETPQVQAVLTRRN